MHVSHFRGVKEQGGFGEARLGQQRPPHWLKKQKWGYGFAKGCRLSEELIMVTRKRTKNPKRMQMGICEDCWAQLGSWTSPQSPSPHGNEHVTSGFREGWCQGRHPVVPPEGWLCRDHLLQKAMGKRAEMRGRCCLCLSHDSNGAAPPRSAAAGLDLGLGGGTLLYSANGW